MTAISPEHIEWATVDRMRQMLLRPHPEFEVTGTLGLFTGILCLTMQRIRTDERETDEIARRMIALSSIFQDKPFRDFLKTEPRAVLTTGVDGHGKRTEVALNSLTEFVADGKPLDAYRSLVAIRNSVAHGDARRLFPINHGDQLIGYHFACTGLPKTNKRPRDETWRGDVCLDAAGMASIAGELADQFCAALQVGDRQFVADAGRVREATSR